MKLVSEWQMLLPYAAETALSLRGSPLETKLQSEVWMPSDPRPRNLLVPQQ